MIWLVKHAMQALYPPHGDLPGIADLEPDTFLVQYKREVSMLMWLGVLLGAVVFAFAPLLTVGIPLPSFLLPKKALDRHADRLASHSIYLVRQSVFLLKLVGGMCWGQHPKVRERLNLTPYQPDPGTWRAA